MDTQHRNWSLFGIIIFFVASLIAPFHSALDYDWISQATGELVGRQNPNGWIMRVGFIALGFCVFIDTLQDKDWGKRDWPFAMFGLTMIGAGLYRQSTVDAVTFLAQPLANAHGWFFIASTGFLILGYLLRIKFSESRREISFTIFTLAVLLLCIFVAFTSPEVAGLADRVAYVSLLLWLLLNPHVAYNSSIDRFIVRRF